MHEVPRNATRMDGTKQKDASMAIVQHMSPATNKQTCDDEDKESMTTSAEKEAREREKCTNGLHNSSVVTASDDIQFEARVAAWTAGPSVGRAGLRVGPGVCYRSPQHEHRW